MAISKTQARNSCKVYQAVAAGSSDSRHTLYASASKKKAGGDEGESFKDVLNQKMKTA
jgi:hypothetical protein